MSPFCRHSNHDFDTMQRPKRRLETHPSVPLDQPRVASSWGRSAVSARRSSPWQAPQGAGSNQTGRADRAWAGRFPRHPRGKARQDVGVLLDQRKVCPVPFGEFDQAAPQDLFKIRSDPDSMPKRSSTQPQSAIACIISTSVRLTRPKAFHRTSSPDRSRARQKSITCRLLETKNLLSVLPRQRVP
jgi:hypothetical protein